MGVQISHSFNIAVIVQRDVKLLASNSLSEVGGHNADLVEARHTVKGNVYALISLSRKAGRAARGVGSHSRRPVIAHRARSFLHE